MYFFYVLATHRWETLLNKLQQNNIHVVFVLASCTDQVQPINLAFNAAFEQYTCMKAQYDEFFADDVANQLNRGVKLTT